MWPLKALCKQRNSSTQSSLLRESRLYIKNEVIDLNMFFAEIFGYN